jgi:hypothetical protein
VRTYILSLALTGFLAAGCSSPSDSGGGGSTPAGSGGKPGGNTGGSKGGSAGSNTGGSAGSSTGGSAGSNTGGSAPDTGGAAGGGAGGSAGAAGSGDDAGSPDVAPGDGGAGGGGMSGTDGGPPLPPGNSPITAGFTMTNFTYEVQWPYKVAKADRYSFDAATNTHICWVKSDDSSFQAGNGTDPRTELRWQEEWTSGKHMLEADVWIAATTDRTNIVQVFSTTPPTTFMLTAWKDRTLRYYFGTGNGPVIMTDAFEKWFNLKVLHDVSTHMVTVFINDVKSMSFADKGSHWHFKNGNYGCRSERCETRWRNLRYWVKP